MLIGFNNLLIKNNLPFSFSLDKSLEHRFSHKKGIPKIREKV
jgi:hypothetical protein